MLVAAAVTVPQVVNLPMLSENPTSGPAAGAGHSTSADAGPQAEQRRGVHGGERRQPDRAGAG